MSNITFYELGHYVGGQLISKTFELSDQETFNTERQEWLDELTEQTGTLCEEWIVCDYEDIPARFVSEYDLSIDFWEYQEAVNEGLDAVAIEAFINYYGSWDKEKFEEAYQGEWDNDEAFAQQILEDCGSIPADLPAYIHIDWTSTARDIMYDYHTESDHYFRCL